MMQRALIAWAAVALMLVTAPVAFAGNGQAKSFEKAQQKAEALGAPLLLKIEADWCSSCASFEKQYEKDSEFQSAASEGVVLHRIDGEKGEGVQIAKSYGVVGYPTFILADARGEIMDSWVGFKNAEMFLQAKTEALSDPTTVAQKLERFRENPTETDAVKLGDLRQSFGYPAEAVAFYKRAQALNPDSETNYDLRILGAMARGAWEQLYTLADVRTQTDAVFASAGGNAKTLSSAYKTISKVASVAGTPEIRLPYLRTAYETLATSSDEKAQKVSSWIYPDYALYIDRDVDAAIAARRGLQPEGWMEDGVQLNQFAWWCFENRVNLEEAETLARRGVELAKAGQDKANVLDTLAELCNVNNNCSHAVQYIRLAITEAPQNEYFQRQLVRFEEILAMGDER